MRVASSTAAAAITACYENENKKKRQEQLVSDCFKIHSASVLI
jgi:hypothetical protein